MADPIQLAAALTLLNIPNTTAMNAAITTAIDNLISGAPGALDTLNELATALGDDANFAATVTAALAGKQPLDSDLTAIAALTTTTYGRSLLTTADLAALKTALALADKANLLDTYNTVTGTTYTLVAGDLGKVIRCTNAAGCVVTGPNNLPEGWNCLILQKGAAQASFAAGSGATVGAWPASGVKTSGLNASISVSVEANAGTAAAYIVAGGVA